MDASPPSPGSLAALLPIMGVVFIAFLIIGIAMPVLPLHVHDGLGLGTFVVGLVAGSQFAASLVSRVWAGRHADLQGAKHAVVLGLLASAAAGVLYLLSLPFRDHPQMSVCNFVARACSSRRRRKFHHHGRASARPPLASVVAVVWLPGVGLALSSFGFGAMTAFLSLLFVARGWTVWPAFTTFAVAFIVARVVLGHDMTLGIASPALGFIAAVAGIGSVFLTSALVVLCAAAVAVRLLLIERSRHGTQTQRIRALDARAG